MNKQINVRITENQNRKILKSGLSYSEFIRRAIDYYDEDIEYQLSLRFIEKCKDILYEYEKNVKKNGEFHRNLYENNKNVKPDSLRNNGKRKDNIYDSEQNVKDSMNLTIKRTLRTELELITRMLNNPDNLGTLPDYTFKKLSKTYNLSVPTIRTFIVDNLTALKEGDYTKIT